MSSSTSLCCRCLAGKTAKEKAPHIVAKRNARERKRVQAVNGAFLRLRRCIPYENRNKRLSKVKTLRIAIEYIKALHRMVLEYDIIHGGPYALKFGPLDAHAGAAAGMGTGVGVGAVGAAGSGVGAGVGVGVGAAAQESRAEEQQVEAAVAQVAQALPDLKGAPDSYSSFALSAYAQGYRQTAEQQITACHSCPVHGLVGVGQRVPMSPNVGSGPGPASAENSLLSPESVTKQFYSDYANYSNYANSLLGSYSAAAYYGLGSLVPNLKGAAYYYPTADMAQVGSVGAEDSQLAQAPDLSLSANQNALADFISTYNPIEQFALQAHRDLVGPATTSGVPVGVGIGVGGAELLDSELDPTQQPGSLSSYPAADRPTASPPVPILMPIPINQSLRHDSSYRGNPIYGYSTAAAAPPAPPPTYSQAVYAASNGGFRALISAEAEA